MSSSFVSKQHQNKVSLDKYAFSQAGTRLCLCLVKAQLILSFLFVFFTHVSSVALEMETSVSSPLCSGLKYLINS